MNKIILLGLASSILLSYSNYLYNGSTKASVTMAGSIISAQHTDYVKKYKRKECPICKGTGKYLSGDEISLVDCGYCEPEKSNKDAELLHPPIILYGNPQPKCTGPNCKVRK